MKLRSAIACLTLLSTLSTFAGNEGGGGGDASEVRVNEIRADILKWITSGGAKDLSLPAALSYGHYVDAMTEILQPKAVVVAFTDQNVLVNKVEKTCRGFFTKFQHKPNIICNIGRFKNTSDSDQYKLIHHEFAGLVNIENNTGAASDYEISSQITDYLQPQTVLRLGVKKVTQTVKPVDQNDYDKACTLKSESILGEIEKKLQKDIDDKSVEVIRDFYKTNHLREIKKITLISKAELPAKAEREFSYRKLELTYKVEAAEDSVLLKIEPVFAYANLVIKGSHFKNTDALGRLKEEGTLCKVKSEYISGEEFSAPFYHDGGISFVIYNAETNETIGVKTILNMTNVYDEEFKF